MTRLLAALNRPHTRHTWNARWMITRLICYPLIAASAAIAALGLVNHDALEPQPETPRIVVERGTDS